MFLPRIGLPKTKNEEFNQLVCEEAVSHYSHLQYTHDREAFEKKYTLLPESKRRQQLENEIIKLIEAIDNHSFFGADDFRNSYFQYIDDLLRNKTNFHSSDYLIGHITHAFLKKLQWNLQFSKQDYIDARESDGPEYVFLIQCTDLLQRFPEIEEMASMLAYCDRLLDVKLMLEEFDEQKVRLPISVERIKKITTRLSNDLKLATNPDDTKKLIEYFLQADLSISSESICIGCSNRDLWYILFKFRELDKKFKVVCISKGGFLKSSQGTILKENHINRAKTMFPPHLSLIDKIFSEN